MSDKRTTSEQRRRTLLTAVRDRFSQRAASERSSRLPKRARRRGTDRDRGAQS